MSEHGKARSWRLAMGITQKELAEQLGIHKKTIANMERGHYLNGKPIPRTIWRNYRLACGGFMHVPKFDWK